MRKVGPRKQMIEMGKDYADRTIKHSLMWVNGNPQHNHIDGECVADFSCCYPEFFTHDLTERMKSHKRLLAKLGRIEPFEV